MSGNTTVVLRQEPGLSQSEMDAHERELRMLFVHGTIREARGYAEDHGVLVVLAEMTQRGGTAFAELAHQTLAYRAVVQGLRDKVQGAKSDECAASRVNMLFALAGQKGNLALQRLIVETMRAWAGKEPEGREKFVADDFLRALAKQEWRPES